MKTFQIKNWKTKEIIYEGEASSLKELVEKAVKEGVSLAYADLSNTNLIDINLRNADLTNASLIDANLYNADLRNVNLCCANLINANLYKVDLHSVDLSNSVLYNVNLNNSGLYNVDLSNAVLYNTNFSNTILDGIKGNPDLSKAKNVPEEYLQETIYNKDRLQELAGLKSNKRRSLRENKDIKDQIKDWIGYEDDDILEYIIFSISKYIGDKNIKIMLYQLPKHNYELYEEKIWDVVDDIYEKIIFDPNIENIDKETVQNIIWGYLHVI